ncbi:MAG: transposase [Sediminibacterium sp.]|jgi:transposase-like protein|nr:transposase [Sediminibacterium sp.]
MTEKFPKKSKPSIHSSQPYKRRSEDEMLEIVREIHEKGLPKKTACRKYGVNRNTLRLFILKQSTKDLSQNHSLDLLSTMNENQQNLALTKKIKELTTALEKSELKVITLQTMIQVAEEDLKIKIRKKSGTKQSKE